MDQGIPLRRWHVGANGAGQIGSHIGLPHGHDLPLEANLEAMEGLPGCGRVLHLEGGQPRVAAQQAEQFFDPGRGATHGAIDPFGGQQHCASHAGGGCAMQQGGAQPRQLIGSKSGKPVKRGNAQAHRPQCAGTRSMLADAGIFPSAVTPAAASSSRSVATSGLPVVRSWSP